MKPSSKALDVLGQAIELGFMYRDRMVGRYYGIPGGAVSKLPKEKREILKGLTSDDTMNMRMLGLPPGFDTPELVVCGCPYQGGYVKEVRERMEVVRRGEERMRSKEVLCSHA